MAWDARTAEIQRTRYRETMDTAIEALGGKCVECDSTDRLEFDHIAPDTKSFNISAKASGGMSAIEDELTKCQLLCRPCHVIKTAQELSVRFANEHGGGREGVSACKCVLCVRRRLDTQNERRAARRAGQPDRRKGPRHGARFRDTDLTPEMIEPLRRLFAEVFAPIRYENEETRNHSRNHYPRPHRMHQQRR